MKVKFNSFQAWKYFFSILFTLNLFVLEGFAQTAGAKNYSSNVTSDGKLNLAGVSQVNKKLFHQIYDGEFASLNIQGKNEYAPYGLFQALLQVTVQIVVHPCHRQL